VGSLQAKEIEPKLRQLIEDTRKVEPKLSARLDEFRYWIKDLKLGLLMSKPFVLGVLKEIIQDVEIRLKIRALKPEKRQKFLAAMNPTEYYWYGSLFSQLINEADPKSKIWKQKIMSGSYTADDMSMIEDLMRQIDKRGSSLKRYVLDFSMATDIIASNSYLKSSYAQVTCSLERSLNDKNKSRRKL